MIDRPRSRWKHAGSPEETSVRRKAPLDRERAYAYHRAHQANFAWNTITPLEPKSSGQILGWDRQAAPGGHRRQWGFASTYGGSTRGFNPDFMLPPSAAGHSAEALSRPRTKPTQKLSICDEASTFADGSVCRDTAQTDRDLSWPHITWSFTSPLESAITQRQ